MTLLDLSGIPFVDGHMHPPYRTHPSDLAAYRWPWYEGSPEDTDLAADTAAYRWGIRELAGDLGVAPDEQAVFDAVTRFDLRTWLADLLRDEAVTGLVADMGYPPPEQSFTAGELADAARVEVAPLLRIEQRAGVLAAESTDFDEFLDRFDAEIGGARGTGYAGLKSVLAYRSGLAVADAGAAEAADAFGRERTRVAEDEPIFLTEKPLLDFLFLRALAVARRDHLPVQLHTGYGDRDLDLPRSNPWLLRDLLERSEDARAVPLVLLHGSYPYTREAAILTAIYPRVYFDVGTCVPPFAWAVQMEVWRTALALVPLSRIHASSDAAGLSEQISLGARQARRTLGTALAELCETGSLSTAEAERAAVDILGGTARSLYFTG
jgi:uncharacterized protein